MGTTYTICNFLQKSTLRLFSNWKVAGAENVPPMGPLVVVSNHISNVDPSLLASSIPRHVKFLAKDSLFRVGISNWFLRSYGAFPIDRDGVDIPAYRWTLEQFKNDGVIILFPEGTRSDGQLIQAKPGIIRLVLRANAPILPIGITGTERLGSVLRVFNPTGKIRVNIGQVFSLPDIEGRPNPDVLESMVTMVMHRITDLLPEDYHGYYRRPARGGHAGR